MVRARLPVVVKRGGEFGKTTESAASREQDGMRAARAARRRTGSYV
jgi:hypothetical protein